MPRSRFSTRSAKTGTALADSLGECAARPLFVPCDLTDTAALRAALGEIRAALGPAAVLVDNAANNQRYEFGQITPEQFDRTIAVNFRHLFFDAALKLGFVSEAESDRVVDPKKMVRPYVAANAESSGAP